MKKNKKLVGKSARALKRRIGLLEKKIDELRAAQVGSGWSIGGATRSPSDSEDAFIAGGTVTEMARESDFTGEAYHQNGAGVPIHQRITNGVKQALMMLRKRGEL